MVSSREILYIVELVYYIPVLPIAIYIVIKHGFGRQVGWVYLCLLSLLRIIGSGAGIAWQHDLTNANLVETTVICSTIGISPLLLCLIAMVHRTHDAMDRSPVPTLLFRLLHLPIIAGLALGVVGGIDQFSSNAKSVSNGHEYTKIAVIIYAASLLAIAGLVGLTLMHMRRIMDGEKRLLLAAAASLPFFVVRILYSCIAAFKYKDADWSFISEKNTSVVLQGVLSIAMEFIIVAIFVTAGLLAHKVPRAQGVQSGGYEANGQQYPMQANYGGQNAQYAPKP